MGSCRGFSEECNAVLSLKEKLDFGDIRAGCSKKKYLKNSEGLRADHTLRMASGWILKEPRALLKVGLWLHG